MTPIRRGDVWWVAFDPAVGGEIRKTRPAVVISNNQANDYLNRVQVVPVSSRVQKLYPCEALIVISGKPGKAMADQIRTVSKERLTTRMATLLPKEIRSIEAAIRLQLELGSP